MNLLWFFAVLSLLCGSSFATTNTYSSFTSGAIYPSGVHNIINVPETGFLTDLTMSISFPSSVFLDEILITLTTPSGIVLIVWDQVACPLDSFNNVQSWNDIGATAGANCPPPALLASQYPFSTINGLQIQGNWDVFAQDVLIDDFVTVSGASLTISFVAAIGGDPHILLFDGSVVGLQVDSIPDDALFVNLLSSSTYQVNSAIRESVLSPKEKYLHQVGISLKNLHYSLLVDTNQAHSHNAVPLIAAIDSEGNLLYDFYEAFTSSSRSDANRVDFLLSQQSVRVEEEEDEESDKEQHEFSECVLSMYRENYSDLELFETEAVDWKQSPLMRSVLRCHDGTKLQVEMHEFLYPVLASSSKKFDWVIKGFEQIKVPRSEVHGESHWHERRLDVYFTGIPSELDSDGVIGQFHEVEGANRRERVGKEMSRIELDEGRNMYVTPVEEEFVIRGNSVLSSEFLANLF